MTRNNNIRTGSPEDLTPPQDNPPPTTGFFFPESIAPADLPTKGLLYPNGHPLHGKEFVEIREITTKEEEILTNKELVRKGMALDKVLANCLVDKSIKIDTLYVGDKNAIVVALRKLSYGSSYKTSVLCPSCGEKSAHEFNLDDVPIKAIEEASSFNNGTFTISIEVDDKSGNKQNLNLEMKLLTDKDETNLRLLTEKREKNNLPKSQIQDLLQAIIVSVNDDRDRRNIEKFVEYCPSKYSKKIREEYNRIAPNLDLTQNFDCPKCNDTSIINIPFNAEFFWPR